MSNTIAVTGASGHLGNVICRQLCEKGYQVKALYHSFSESLLDLPIELIQGDILNPADLEKLMTGCSAVINSAAIISIHGDPSGIVFKTNTEGPRQVLEVAKRLGIKRIVHISSVHAVQELPLSTLMDETRPYKTATAFPYDYSKATGEQILLAGLQEDGPEVVIVRPTCIIGPFDFKPSELGNGLLQLYRRQLPALPEGGFNFVDVRDVAASTINAIDQGRNGEAYFLAGKYYTMIEMADRVCKIIGKKNRLWVLPFGFLKSLLPLVRLYARITGIQPPLTLESITAVKNGHPNMITAKAEKELGLQFRPLENSIQDFFDWYQTRKPLNP